ncbi:hypothetical protein [Lewinella sp. 4G2]|uniref:hypothetical protein n=1 Tax=Lewinella sp. 4G2 TaxID=1803372 RepID=UPI0007B4F412|nr:hypothetical protein [Lewinella sp. 4G2]OAV42738.1 hypothetical protein A3850_015980 [Lewinella sp. 4G2]
MQDQSPPSWLPYVSWVPVLLYFAVKYFVIGQENMTGRQHLYLIGAVILAEIALWKYRKQFTRPTNNDEHGTD